MNLHYAATKTIVHFYLLGTLVLSFGHIVELFHLLGATGPQAYLAPLFIDGIAILGWLGRSQRMAPSTRRTGFRLQIIAGAVSLACNILAGHTAGDRLFGAMVVIGFVVAEWYAAKLRPTRKGTPAAARPAKPAVKVRDRSAAGRKGAATRKANAARTVELAPARAAAAMN